MSLELLTVPVWLVHSRTKAWQTVGAVLQYWETQSPAAGSFSVPCQSPITLLAAECLQWGLQTGQQYSEGLGQGGKW